MSGTLFTRARASALLFGAAALGSIALPGRAQSTASLRVAIVPIAGAAEVYYAKDLGFFANAGMDVEIDAMASSPAVAAAVASNSADVGFLSVDALATIHQKDIPLAIIAPAAQYVSAETARTAAIVVTANSPVHAARDLNGKTIAVNALHTLSTLATSAWVDQHGGDSSTVRFVELPFPAMAAALDAGRVDAAALSEPFLSAAGRNDRVLQYGFDAISKHFLLTSWCTMAQWAMDHPDLVRRFAGCIRDAAVWANKNPEKSGEIFAKYTKANPADIATMVHPIYLERLTPALVQPLIDVSAKYNGFTSFPAENLVYASSR